MKMTALHITRYAFTKWNWWCQHHSTEVSGCLLTKPGSLTVVDCDLVHLDEPPSSASVSEDQVKLLQFCEQKEEEGFDYPWIWVHTHPGNSATPSKTDRDHFSDMMATGASRAGMAILAKGGDTSFHMAVRDREGHVHVINYGKWVVVDDVELDEEAMKARSAECVPKPVVTPAWSSNTGHQGRYSYHANLNFTPTGKEDDDGEEEDPFAEQLGDDEAYEFVTRAFEEISEGQWVDMRKLREQARKYCQEQVDYYNLNTEGARVFRVAYWKMYEETLNAYVEGGT